MWGAVLLTSFTATLVLALNNPFGGDYHVSFRRIDPCVNFTKAHADWYAKLEKRTQRRTDLVAWFEVKRPIVGPKALFKTRIEKNGKFVPMAVDKVAQEAGAMSLCDMTFKKKYFYDLFRGDVVWTNETKDCVIYPGKEVFREDREFDLNAMAHKLLPSTPYGIFEVTLTVVDNEGTAVGGLLVEVNVQPPKEEGGGGKGRSKGRRWPS